MPFSLEMLMDYFAVYNERIWPMQLLGYAVGLLTLVPLFRPGKAWDRVVTAVLAFLWLWVGLVFWLQAARGKVAAIPPERAVEKNCRRLVFMATFYY